MTYDGRQWCETEIPGLHVRTGFGTAGTRLLGWQGILPFSVIGPTVLSPGLEGPAPTPRHVAHQAVGGARRENRG